MFRFSGQFLLKKWSFVFFIVLVVSLLRRVGGIYCLHIQQCLNLVMTRHSEASRLFHMSECTSATCIRTQKTVEAEADLKEVADANILRRKELPDGYFP